MPSLYASGMMTQPGFASAGYLLFGSFNHVELLCGALVVTGVLISSKQHQPDRSNFVLAIALLSIALLSTYGLTPQMSALSLDLNLFESSTVVPSAMQPLHLSYWGLEIMKLLAGITLMRRFYSSLMA
jgi:hypothetical protein